MKIEYKGKKWDKEVENIKKYKKTSGGILNKNEIYNIEEFQKNGSNDYLRLYIHLASCYEQMVRWYYLDNICSEMIGKYTYLSGIAFLVAKRIYSKGIQTKYINIIKERIESGIDFALFQLIASGGIENSFIKYEENNLIMLMFRKNYDQAKMLLDQITGDPDEAKEIYYIESKYLKKIYMAIIEHDEIRFNEELGKRIKKYRRNMVGYSTIVDIVSVALIKIAEREGLHCTVDVIEIPRQFFDNTDQDHVINAELPFYNDFLKLNII